MCPVGVRDTTFDHKVAAQINLTEDIKSSLTVGAHGLYILQFRTQTLDVYKRFLCFGNAQMSACQEHYKVETLKSS